MPWMPQPEPTSWASQADGDIQRRGRSTGGAETSLVMLTLRIMIRSTVVPQTHRRNKGRSPMPLVSPKCGIEWECRVMQWVSTNYTNSTPPWVLFVSHKSTERPRMTRHKRTPAGPSTGRAESPAIRTTNWHEIPSTVGIHRVSKRNKSLQFEVMTFCRNQCQPTSRSHWGRQMKRSPTNCPTA